MKNQIKVKKEERDMKGEYWDIIAKYLTHEELSVDEKKEFDQLSADEEFNEILSQSSEVVKKSDLFFNLKNYNTDKAWEKVNGQLAPKRKSILYMPWVFRVAAIFLLLFTTSVVVWRLGINKQELCEFATTQYDFSNPGIELPDGTKVKLNHGSKLTYPEEFSGKIREVSLTGEAFFDVTPNPEKPFIIKTNDASIKVLGTSFNVYAYSESSTVEVIVKTGKVELSKQDLTEKAKVEKVLLLPGEKGTFNKLNKTVAKEATFNPNNLSWFTHEIEFKYTRLSDVFLTLKKAYNLQITIEEGVDLSQELNATFSQQQPDYIMEVIAMTQNLKLKKQANNQYIIQNKDK
jgi:transmembrane sensor